MVHIDVTDHLSDELRHSLWNGRLRLAPQCVKRFPAGGARFSISVFQNVHRAEAVYGSLFRDFFRTVWWMMSGERQTWVVERSDKIKLSPTKTFIAEKRSESIDTGESASRIPMTRFLVTEFSRTARRQSNTLQSKRNEEISSR